MKTKNIFRAFLMAVILLVGGNSAKAEILYENSSGSGGYAYITLPFGAFDGFQGGKLRITYALLEGSHTIQIGNVANVSVTDSGVYEMPLDNNFYSKINTTDQYNASTFIQPANVTIYTIEAVSAGVSYNISLAAMENGTISVPSSAKAGAIVTLTPKPNDGYKLDWMNVRDADGGNVTVTNNQFIMPDKDVTVYAGFVEKVTHVTASISNAGYATFWSEYALDFSQVDGDDLKAYYAKSANDTTVVLERVTGTVAEETGLILVGSTTDIPVVDDGYNYTGNLLRCAYSDITVGAGCYVLTIEGGVVKFASTANTSAVVPEGHAYLDFGSSARNYSRLAVVFAGETTGIEDRTLVGQEENVYYDLRGVRVAKPTHGIYIVNGKKVFVK